MTSPTAYLPLRARMMKAGCWPTRLLDDEFDAVLAYDKDVWVWEYKEGVTVTWTEDAANAIRIAAVEWLLRQDATFWFEQGDAAHDIQDDYAIAFLNPEPSDDDISWRGPDLDAALIAALDALLEKEEV